MAMGVWSRGGSTREVDMILYAQAKALLTEISFLKPGSMSLLQALLLLSDFAQKKGFPETGLSFIGTAANMALNTVFAFIRRACTQLPLYSNKR